MVSDVQGQIKLNNGDVLTICMWTLGLKGLSEEVKRRLCLNRIKTFKLPQPKLLDQSIFFSLVKLCFPEREHPFIDRTMVLTEPCTKRTAITPGFETVSQQQTAHAQQRSYSIHAQSFLSNDDFERCASTGRGLTKVAIQILYRRGVLTGKKHYFRLTSVAQKRLCLSSLIIKQAKERLCWQVDRLQNLVLIPVPFFLHFQGYYSCLRKSTCNKDSVEAKTTKMDSLLNNAPASFGGMILEFSNTGCFYYICSRNNNFSNRSQKGVICIK